MKKRKGLPYKFFANQLAESGACGTLTESRACHAREWGGSQAVPFHFESSFESQASVSRPIGVFDSGLGGLTVVRAMRRLLPSEDIVYFGDIARLPYGIKSPAQILKCSKDNTEFLMNQRIKALVVACNSSASASLDVLQNCYKIPVIADVIRPAAWEAVRLTQNGRIGIMGTQATVRSGIYERYIKQYAGQRKIRVFSAAAPLLVPLVETGWLKDSVTHDVVERYLKPLKAKRVDTLILGCTHFPLLRNVIAGCFGRKVHIIDAAPLVARALKRSFERSDLLSRANGRIGRLKVFLSDTPEDFKRIGERFLGERLMGVEKVLWT